MVCVMGRGTFLTPPVAGALLRAALVASCLRGALPPVDLRAVCFVRAMLMTLKTEGKKATKAVSWADSCAADGQP